MENGESDHQWMHPKLVNHFVILYLLFIKNDLFIKIMYFLNDINDLCTCDYFFRIDSENSVIQSKDIKIS